MEFYSNWILNKSAFGALPCCFCILENHSPLLTSDWPFVHLFCKAQFRWSILLKPFFFFLEQTWRQGGRSLVALVLKLTTPTYYPSIETVYSLHKDPERVLFTKLPCRLIHGPFHRCLVIMCMHSSLHSLLFRAFYLLSPLWLTSGTERKDRRYLSKFQPDSSSVLCGKHWKEKWSALTNQQARTRVYLSLLSFDK